MKYQTLPPIRTSPVFEGRLAKQIMSVITRQIYKKLAQSIHTPLSRLVNSKGNSRTLRTALQDGLVRYDGAGFTGQISSAVSKELRELGAKWRHPKWVIPSQRLPSEIRSAIQDATIREFRLREAVDALLSNIDPDSILAEIHPEKVYRRIESNINTQFNRSIRSLTVQPALTRLEKSRITEEYTENLRLAIKNWVTEDVLKLRKEVQEHVFQGNRYASLANVIKINYGIAERKARFLARQETNLLTAKIRETRYEQAGIDEYLWVSVTGTAAHPVRPLHKKLDAESKAGKIFKFSDPPVSGTNGEKQNPGEPYNCRCVARPVVRRQSR